MRAPQSLYQPGRCRENANAALHVGRTAADLECPACDSVGEVHYVTHDKVEAVPVDVLVFACKQQ